MKKTFSFIVVAVLAAAVFSGCGGGGGDNPPPNTMDPNPVLGTLITSPTVSPITSFGQSIVSHDTGTNNNSYDTFPGQPNVWDIAGDFSLEDGNDDQFDNALQLVVGATGAFLPDQVYSELTFYTPTMSSADGVKVAAVSDGVSMGITSALTGSYSAFLNATSYTRLQQTLDLSGTTAPILLRWNHNASMYGGNVPGFTPNYRVVVRDFLTGNELEELSATTVDELYSAAPFLNYAGQKVILSFEMSNMPEDWQVRGVIIDDVSVKDNNGAGTERVVNGDFETGDLTGWSTNTPAEVQNMTSGARPLDNLIVKRSFYTVPNKLWARWVDVFENPDLVNAVTTTVTYHTDLGSDNCGVIYTTPGTGNKAITSWDTMLEDRDIGMVTGLVSSLTYSTNTSLSRLWASCDGSEFITFDYVITVPAGGKAAIVNFIIMGSYDTGLTAVNTSARATEVDQEAARIVTNFWADGQYRTGMTQEQINAIKNF